MRALMWFRSDLRLSDNPALHAAARRADDGVVAVFVISPDQWAAHDMAPVRVDFILRNLRALSDGLAEKNVALHVLETATFKGVPRTLRGLAIEHECDALFFNREYEVNERRRDDDVTEAFEGSGAAVHAFTDQCLFEPGAIRTGEDNFYSVFTPFRKAWCKALEADRDRAVPLDRPRKQPEMVGTPGAVPQTVDGFDADAARPDLWTAGERSAHGKLGAFVGHRIDDYHDARDLPAANGTSVLSPYLVSGVLSLRQCLAAALDANGGRVDSGKQGVTTWISELVWREFYKHVLVGWPRVSMHRAFRPETEAVPWRDDDGHFEAWCAGATGFPIVDAAMRQLARTGWMHNRLRMIAAMFLTKNLLLDWRRGERHFMQHLVDGDLAANNGGWQWSASTGTDAAPYFRVFNPWSQSRKCDPDGAFIRRFVPELEDVATKALHDPDATEARQEHRSGYPAPVVDHAKTRKRAIEAFKAL